MRIAFCFSGLLRDIEVSKKHWVPFIEKYNGDVYLSTWDVEDEDSGDTINCFNDSFKPKNIEVESYDTFKKTTFQRIWDSISPPSILDPRLYNNGKNTTLLPMYYKIWRANLLAATNDYDLIVRCRTDIIPDFNFDLVLDDNIHLPSGVTYVPQFKNSTGFNDMFAFGSIQNMNYYSSLFLYLMHYISEGHYTIPAENMLKVHLAKKAINIHFIPVQVYFVKHLDNAFNKNLSHDSYITNAGTYPTDVDPAFKTKLL